jgi:hypothetical protein
MWVVMDVLWKEKSYSPDPDILPWLDKCSLSRCLVVRGMKTWVRLSKTQPGEWEGGKKTYSSFHSQSVRLRTLLFLW